MDGDECACPDCAVRPHVWHPDADTCTACGVPECMIGYDLRGRSCPGGPGTGIIAISHHLVLAGIAESKDIMGL